MAIRHQSDSVPVRCGRARNQAGGALTGCSVFLLVSACHSMQGRSESWAAVNTVQNAAVAPHIAPHASYSAPSVHAAVETATVRLQPRLQNSSQTMTLRQAIDALVPATYRLDIADDLNLNTSITVDRSANWLEALGQGLSDANIEFITNLYSKSATIRWNKVALAQVIKTWLPTDFTVYCAAGIDLQSPVRFDTRQYWAEALSLGALDSGIALTINYGNKIIALRPADGAARRVAAQSGASAGANN